MTLLVHAVTCAMVLSQHEQSFWSQRRMGHSASACCVDLLVRMLTTIPKSHTFLFFWNHNVIRHFKILKIFCEGKYTYNGHQYDATARPEGAVYEKCREEITNALKLNAPCHTKNCTFDGVWNGGGGAGQSNIYATSSFYYLASHVA